MENKILLPARLNLNINTVTSILKQRKSRPEFMELIPVSELMPLIHGLEDAAKPAEIEQAKRAAEVLLGSYPRHNIEAPEIYSRAIVSVLINFPAHVGAKAVDNLTLKSQFIPTRSELNAQCEAIMGEIRAAQAIAKSMIQEHKRRESSRQEQEERAKARKEFRDKHGNKTPMEVLAAEGITIGKSTKRKN